MSKQTISIGTVANDNTGDTLRAAGAKLNYNFTELYDGLAEASADIAALEALFNGSGSALLAAGLLSSTSTLARATDGSLTRWQSSIPVRAPRFIPTGTAPIADGTYTPLTITTVDGYITAVTE